MIVAGYYLEQSTVGDVCREIGELREAEHPRIMRTIGGNDWSFEEPVRAAPAVASDHLRVDAHWRYWPARLGGR